MAHADFAPLKMGVSAPEVTPQPEPLPSAATATVPSEQGATTGSALDPAWRSGGSAAQQGAWAQGSSVAAYGAEADVLRRRERIEQERLLADLALERRFHARQVEADIWADELEELGQVGARVKARERHARETLRQPVGAVEALLHPKGRSVLAAGVATAAATKGLLALLAAPEKSDIDTQREVAARRWTGAALLAGLVGLMGIAQSVGADGVRADRSTALATAEAEKLAASRERREAQRRHAGWVGGRDG